MINLTENFLEENKEIKNKTEIIKILLDMTRFQKMSEIFDEDYVYTIEKTENNLKVAVNCLDASKFILKTIKEKDRRSGFL